MRGGLLGGFPYLGGLGGVEMPPTGGQKPDITRLPNADDQRVAPGRKLVAGPFDRELCQLGAIVGEDHQASGRGGLCGMCAGRRHLS